MKRLLVLLLAVAAIWCVQAESRTTTGYCWCGVRLTNGRECCGKHWCVMHNQPIGKGHRMCLRCEQEARELEAKARHEKGANQVKLLQQQLGVLYEKYNEEVGALRKQVEDLAPQAQEAEKLKKELVALKETVAARDKALAQKDDALARAAEQHAQALQEAARQSKALPLVPIGVAGLIGLVIGCLISFSRGKEASAPASRRRYEVPTVLQPQEPEEPEAGA